MADADKTLLINVQTYNRTGYDAYQAILRRPVANADYTPRDGEYTDVLVTLTGAFLFRTE